ncbi:MAG: clostripain-related cysteine peptidase [Elusimicrobiaceae bacterium]|nr:clostripain-related cysteine peptidase [Elusimicrobiaceae bacterium]
MFRKSFAVVASAMFLATGVSFARVPAISTLGTPDQFKDVVVPQAKTKAATWTIMVYVNAKNNLEEYGLKDVNEMEMVGSNDKVNVVAELGRIRGYSSVEGNWTGSRRYLVQKDNDASNITSPVLVDMPKTDMGDWKHLVDFAQWAKAAYPAKNYMLIVWNHGAGWIKNSKGKGISYDDESGNHMTTPQLAQALKEIGGLQVYGSDACLMQMASVDYEIKDYVDYIVGSEETEPGDGYTYDTFLAQVNASDLSSLAVGKAAVDAYTDHYVSIQQGATQSLVKTAAMPGFIAALDAFVDATMATNDKTSVKTARSKTVSYAYSDNKSLSHFVNNLLGITTDEKVKTTGAALVKYTDNELVVHNRTNTGTSSWDNKNYGNSKGLAIYLPSYNFNATYKELQFAKNSKWADFIQWINAKDTTPVPAQ